MNEDVLECKRKAQELITSDRAPVNGNGRKKGYIEGQGHFSTASPPRGPRHDKPMS